MLSLSHALALIAASIIAGAMNSMAGGGTLVTFPTLLFLGTPAIAANATSAVGLLPGAIASFVGYRREVASHRRWLRSLLLPSLLGGAAGSVLLLATPEATFSHLAPFLVLFATILFGIQGLLRRRARRRGAGPTVGPPSPKSTRLLVAAFCQLGVATYGGYFGAGIGILMLAVLGFMGLTDIHAMNGLKTFFGAAINSVAVAYFIFRGAVLWPLALVMILGAVIGGYGGAQLARRIGARRVRYVVIAIGLIASAVLAWREFSP